MSSESTKPQQKRCQDSKVPILCYLGREFGLSRDVMKANKEQLVAICTNHSILGGVLWALGEIGVHSIGFVGVCLIIGSGVGYVCTLIARDKEAET